MSAQKTYSQRFRDKQNQDPIRYEKHLGQIETTSKTHKKNSKVCTLEQYLPRSFGQRRTIKAKPFCRTP